MWFVFFCKWSAEMLVNLGIPWVIIGSLWKESFMQWNQRRTLFNESPCPFGSTVVVDRFIRKFGISLFSLLETKLHTHFLKVWMWLLVLERLLKSGKLEPLCKLLLHKLRQLQVYLPNYSFSFIISTLVQSINFIIPKSYTEYQLSEVLTHLRLKCFEMYRTNIRHSYCELNYSIFHCM